MVLAEKFIDDRCMPISEELREESRCNVRKDKSIDVEMEKSNRRKSTLRSISITCMTFGLNKTRIRLFKPHSKLFVLVLVTGDLCPPQTALVSGCPAPGKLMHNDEANANV